MEALGPVPSTAKKRLYQKELFNLELTGRTSDIIFSLKSIISKWSVMNPSEGLRQMTDSLGSLSFEITEANSISTL
jgi:hypothetical protein